MKSIIAKARENYHKALLDSILSIDENGIPSNADKTSRSSVAIAKGITDKLVAQTHEKVVGQTSGKKFEEYNMLFLQETFPFLQNIRPGKWRIVKMGNNSQIKTSDFSQYEHLAYLTQLTKNNSTLAASLGNDYMVSPDVIIYRELCNDSELNQYRQVVDSHSSLLADLRYEEGKKNILHASISAKWTIRSDRAQNSRTEALNLIRNRKGHLPHIVVVTAEPLPSRLASIALGTGDIDCVYHFALYELIESVRESGGEEAINMLNILIDGKRLKDISDLPLDLSV